MFFNLLCALIFRTFGLRATLPQLAPKDGATAVRQGQRYDAPLRTMKHHVYRRFVKPRACHNMQAAHIVHTCFLLYSNMLQPSDTLPTNKSCEGQRTCARALFSWLACWAVSRCVCVCVCCFLGTCFEITSQHTVVENRTSSNHGFCTVLLWVSPAWKILKSGPVSKNQAALQRVILAIQRRCWDGTWWNHP